MNTNDPTVSFFALGDWGGAGITGALSCYTSLIPSLNTPSPAQLSSAKVMGILGSQHNSKFQLGLGDNFYCKFKKVSILFYIKYSTNLLLDLFTSMRISIIL